MTSKRPIRNVHDFYRLQYTVTVGIFEIFHICKIVDHVVDLSGLRKVDCVFFFLFCLPDLHATETTLLKIHNDLILAMDRGEVISLLLDLSAAFDTVDHSTRLTRLQNWFGLDGLSLDWFSSTLSSRSHAVSINDSHLCIHYSFLWCSPRFRSWPTHFHSLHNSSWLGDLKKSHQISFVRWW